MGEQEHGLSIDLARSLLAHVQGMVDLADRKIQILLAADAVLIALLISSTPGVLKDSFGAGAPFIAVATGVVALLLLGAVGCSILFAFLVLRPRLEFGQHRSSFYFGHIAAKPVAQFVDDFSAMSEPETIKDLLRQIHANSLIANAKFRWVTVSTYALIVALFFWLVLVVLRMLA